MLTGSYRGDTAVAGETERIVAEMAEGNVDAQTLLTTYCRRLYERFGTYEEVARRLRLDRRTVKKYLKEQNGKQNGTALD